MKLNLLFVEKKLCQARLYCTLSSRVVTPISRKLHSLNEFYLDNSEGFSLFVIATALKIAKVPTEIPYR